MGQKVIPFEPGVRGHNFTVSYTTHLLTRTAGVDQSRVVIQMFGTLMLLFAKITGVMLFNRPGVAGAVLQPPPSLIDSLIQSVILFLPIFKIS